MTTRNTTPSSSQEICRVSSSWEIGSYVDLFPSPRSKSVISSHAVDYDQQFVEPIEEYNSIYCSKDSEMDDSD